MATLQEVAPGLWEAYFPLRLLGVSVGRRMVVVRMGDGTLHLHSPGPLDYALKREIESVGPVSAIVIPTNFHDGFLLQAQTAFPDVPVIVPNGFSSSATAGQKLLKLEEQTPSWEPVLFTQRLEGMHLANEHVFYHPASRTLLVSDLVFNFGLEADPWTRLFFKLNGAYNRLRPTRMFRACIRDKMAFRKSMESIFMWDFDRLLPSHGKIVIEHARTRLLSDFPQV